MKRTSALLLLIAILFASVPTARASHESGGEITYKSLGGLQYKVSLALYWDCSAFDPGPTVQMATFNNGGFVDLNFTVTLDTAYEVSQLCAASLSSSTCNGGTLAGHKKNVYSGVVTLPGTCTIWTFYHNSCCRNLAINAPNYDSFTFYATLNNFNFLNNNSAYFTSMPLPYVCVGQQVCYSPGAVETDGDILSFSLVDAMSTSPTTPITYAAGYSGTAPLVGITIDPVTGLIQFTPNLIGNFVVAYQVTESDAFGHIRGTAMRDIEMVVSNCTNQVVACNSGAISSVTGVGASILPPNTIQVCENIPFSFQFSFTDPDAGDSLDIISNINAVMPGATVAISGSNPIVVTVGWTAPVGTSNTYTTFAVTVSDNVCPYPGQQTVNYIINVLSITNAGPDVTICGSQATTLVGHGPGSPFNWSVISGPPMVTSGVGINFSCDTCLTAIATPAFTTTYLLTSTGGSGCILNDTVTVYVVPDFTYSVTQSTITSCLLSPVQLNVTNVVPGPATNYTYHWFPATHLSNANIANPTASFLIAGTYTYTVTITSANGCEHSSTVTITAVMAYTPLISATSDTSLCAGGVAALNVNFAGSGTPTCGISLTNCGGNASMGIIGTEVMSNASTSFPAPFGNFYTSVVQQYLYTTAELNAAGVYAGKIDQIDFNVTGITAGALTNYPEFGIKMGCTGLTTFNAGAPVFSTSLVSVFSPQPYVAALGWNNFVFTNAYNWDGVSNIIVEVCFSNGPPFANYTYCLQSTQTPTTYTSSQWSLSDSQDQCPGATGFITTANVHPDIRMHYCSVNANPSDYTYQWTSFPSGGNIANDTLQYTTGQPGTTTNYVVTVTNANYACSATDTVSVTVIVPEVIITSSVTAICSLNPVVFTATPVNGGVLPMYQWYVNSIPVGTDSVNYTTSTLADGDTVYCIMNATNALCPGASTSNSIILHIGVPNTGPPLFQTVCDSVIYNGQTFSADGAYPITLTNFSGCDSAVTLNLTVHNSSSSTSIQNTCDPVIVNGQTYTTSGIYTQMFTNTVGCDSTLVLDLTIINTDVSLTYNASLLSSNQTGASYQWLNCTTGYSIIAGETNQYYVVTTNGNYAVVITNGACVDTSACYTINNIGIAENNLIEEITIFPNPTTGEFQLSVVGYQLSEIKITNVLGQIVYQQQSTDNRQLIDISSEPKGIYFIQLETENGMINKKLILQ